MGLIDKGFIWKGNGSLSAERRRTEKLNNIGYSLVEMVIVIAILALIISTAFYSVIMVFSANAKTTANNIQRAIADCKVTTMGRSAAYMELYRDASDDSVYTKMWIWDNSAGDYAPAEPQKVGTSRVYVGYKPESGTETELLAGDSIGIGFDRASGGFTKDASGHNYYDLYEVIYVRGGSKNYRIVLTDLTGKSEVKVGTGP